MIDRDYAKNKAEILALLTALGDTGAKVAESLQQLGIHGKVGDCRTCPIAAYLMLKTRKLVSVNISDGEVSIATDMDYFKYGFGFHLVAVRDFIRAFDKGKYPQCEIG